MCTPDSLGHTTPLSFGSVVVVVVVARLEQPVLTASGPGLQLGPEIRSHPFQGNWGLLFILGKVVEKLFRAI